MITLRYLAAGSSFTDLHYQFKCGISTISQLVHDTCNILWHKLQSICMPPTSQQEWLDIAEGFKKHANFPNCLGAIDGKHIRMMKPEQSGSLYFNYKHYFSMVLLAVCDSEYYFRFIDVGSYGKSADSQVFKNSELFRRIQENILNIPRAQPITASGQSLPFSFVGDEAFALGNHIQRPYGGKSLTVKKRVYNYRLSRARRYIECSFGILTNKWRIFHRPLNVNAAFAADLIKACCVLHNFVRKRDGFRYEETLEIHGFEDINTIAPHTRHRTAMDVRDKFAEYFLSPEGAIAWQMSKI
ncbi:DDE superfamily endonuclease [Popillia japonica]